jgi:hypothetical protein
METSRYCEEFQILRKISAEFLSGIWQCWSNLRALPAASLFCFGQFVFDVMFSCIVSACVPYCYRAASPMATERIRTVSVFIGRCSSGFGSCV